MIFMGFSTSSEMKKKPQTQIETQIKTHLSFHVVGLFIFFLVVDSQVTNDCEVMNDVKKSLILPSDYWADPNCCSGWEGVSCDRENRVIKIQLKEGVAVSGTLPVNFNSLTALQHLELRGSKIKVGGALPTLKGLTNLQHLLLSENNFTSIPDDFFEGLAALQDATLDQLPLSPWRIPESLRTCTQLRNFSVNSANVVGNIPGFLNGDVFLSLQEIHLSGNGLEGGLPLNFSSLTTLQSLWLNGLKLNGTIEVLQNMTSLNQVWLNMNSFTGPLPDFSGLQSLWDLNLRDNQFTGPVPDSLTTLKSLKSVKLTNNLLQGTVPVFDKSVDVDLLPNTNGFCSGECSSNMNAMLSIAKNLGYPVRFAKQGANPCTWLGVTCIAGNITVINFPNMKLTGTISPSFSLFTKLRTLVLSNNGLYGTIPTELSDLKELKELDLSNNQLSGDVPGFSQNVAVKIGGNKDIGENVTTPPSPGTSPGTSPGNAPPGSSGSSRSPPPAEKPAGSAGKKSSVGVIVGGVIGAVGVFLLLGLVGICVCKKKRKSGGIPNAMVVHPHHSGSDPDMVKITVAGSNMNVGAANETYSIASSGPSDIQMVDAGNMVISIQVLRNVTNNFSEDNVLGRGGFGTVYKGELHDGTMIAVKRMESGVMGSKGLSEFKSEIDVLNKVRHRHLVSLIGYCLDGNERILVYEYMPMGTLSEHLFSWKDEGLKPLNWTRRLSIALDVARGVEYLHGLASQSFIHRDLKPSNILLGDDMRAKVADFGLVRLAPEGKYSIETRLAGTFGYLAPEYAATGRVTTKVDVYAIGVILMELITGRKALDESQPDESMHLVTWFRRMCINKDTSHKAIDPAIDTDEESLASISRVSELAGYCCSREPHQRPDMGHVVNVLSSLVELWKPSSTDPEDIYAIDMELSLAQTLKKWQAFDGDSSMDRNTSSFLASMDNTQTSIPTRPSGFADSFTSADGR